MGLHDGVGAPPGSEGSRRCRQQWHELGFVGRETVRASFTDTCWWGSEDENGQRVRPDLVMSKGCEI